MNDEKYRVLLKEIKAKFDSLGAALVYYELTQSGPLTAPQIARNVGYTTARVNNFLQYLRYHGFVKTIKKGRVSYHDAIPRQP